MMQSKAESKVKGVMSFEAVICICIEPNKKGEKKRKKFSDHFIVQFQKNNIMRELIIKEAKIYADLCKFLRFKCILTTFHEEYTVIKGIGKGSFAKVCLFLAKNKFFTSYTFFNLPKIKKNVNFFF